jgi:hypothetical protein
MAGSKFYLHADYTGKPQSKTCLGLLRGNKYIAGKRLLLSSSAQLLLSRLFLELLGPEY